MSMVKKLDILMKGQAERREEVLWLLRQSVKERGENQLETGATLSGLRERLLIAFSLLSGQDEEGIKHANHLIEQSSYYFCHFSPAISIQILKRCGERLQERPRELLLTYLGSAINGFLGSELDFIGVNDNFPCLAAYTVLFAGDCITGEYERWRSIGQKRLEQFRDLLRRRGAASEFNSPTYTAIQLLMLAEIANSTKDEGQRAIAIECEGRVWEDALGHYHPGTGQQAGPYSRASVEDSMCHAPYINFPLYAVLGAAMPINPLRIWFPQHPEYEVIVKGGDEFFMQFSAAWLMNTEYHVPGGLLEWAVDKPEPYLHQARAEVSASTDDSPHEQPPLLSSEPEWTEYPAGTTALSTFMTSDYALGAATKEFHNGSQTDSFHLLYRRTEIVRSQSEVAAVYARYVINVPEEEYLQRHLLDEGRKIGVHHENAAMMLYKPKILNKEPISSLKLSLIFSAQPGTLQELRLGDRLWEGSDMDSAEACPVYIREGSVYMAFLPVPLTDHGRGAAVKVRTSKGFVIVSFYNYEGEERHFSSRELAATGNGFVVEVGSARQHGSFEQFRTALYSAAVSEVWRSSPHSRWTLSREVAYVRDGLSLACEYSPASEGIRSILVNGQEPPPPRLHMSGWTK